MGGVVLGYRDVEAGGDEVGGACSSDLYADVEGAAVVVVVAGGACSVCAGDRCALTVSEGECAGEGSCSAGVGCCEVQSGFLWCCAYCLAVGVERGEA